ncbi:MAG: potassium transporter, partial [Alistipes sp.]|nr:potassium transporter [Alistipes sp.]
GFPILVNLKNALFYSVKYGYSTLIRRQKPTKYTHLAQLNTKIAVTMTLILLIGGTIAIAATEWNGAFAGMCFSDKLVHSIFNAVSPRTAGFNSVSLTNFSLLALIIYIILMWIGGASQSTAGGIKVNTLSVATASFLAVVRGDRSVTMFNREISNSSVLRAYATIFGSVMAILGCFVALVLLEPGLDVFDLFFETVSALSTVGSSLGVTPHLCTASKLLVSVMMFVGRVGLITVAMSIFAHRERPHYRLPAGDVIIN